MASETDCLLRHASSSAAEDVTQDMDAKPLLSRFLSYPIANTNTNPQRRRRLSAKLASAPRPLRQQSFGRDIGHAAKETYLITSLSFTLLQYLGVGYRWMTRLLALGCYAMLLMPGFLQVRRSIVYGDQPRNRLDLYLPANSDGKNPVVVFVTGGAWIIGYKAWGSLLGLQLAERDIIVACVDYRNFPQGTISDMVRDASEGISYICNNIADYGGDPNRIYLMGQSAGAHISSCALLEQAIKESKKEESISWSVSQIKAYFGLSGGYNLINLVDHFDNRGLYRSIFLSIMEGEESLHQFSPELKVKDPSNRNAVSLLPPITLFHGTADYSIPSDASKIFVDALQKAGAQAKLILYDGKTHTDLFLQVSYTSKLNLLLSLLQTSDSIYYSYFGARSLRGGKDELFDQLIAVIHAGDKEALEKYAMAPPRKRWFQRSC
ncbi:isoprenylcysteine alpha-carbonyl methylesterase ICME-like [Prunus yedoensis var. nudiflora]|uniref:protein-S-isoprenylcysteine alpha-carbonyl methylesterase n=1 Tax=Prunus yedoensis var. nudiflora TaxID=2094558 RepID=A0A314ZAP7_PRUYE|nr:isoprenylcysteine alpha-carbonyl methylesterase ICME-like [Prunus yedoensis var. nudiflora]